MEEGDYIETLTTLLQLRCVDESDVGYGEDEDFIEFLNKCNFNFKIYKMS
jgi:hypothetical protein